MSHRPLVPLTIAVLVLSSTEIRAGAHPYIDAVGLRVGGTMFDLRGSAEPEDGWAMIGVDDSNPLGGFTAGFFFSCTLNDRFSFQPEISYVGKGTKTTVYEGLTPTDGESEVRFKYIDVSTLFRYYVDNSSPTRWSVYAGPVFSWKLDADIDPEPTLYKTDFRETALGAAIGTGFGFQAWGGELSLDARYATDLTELMTSDRASTVKNQGVSLALAYSFINPTDARNRAIESSTLYNTLRRLDHGTRVRVDVAGTGLVEGTLASVNADSLSVSTTGGLVNVPAGNVNSVKKWGQDVTKPLIVGLVSGATLGLLIHMASDNDPDEITDLDFSSGLPAALGAVGALIGVGLGSADRWLQIYP